jgi:hypothetical protein
MNVQDFKQLSEPSIISNPSKLNPQSTETRTTYTNILNGLTFVYTRRIIKDKTGKIRRRTNIFRIGELGLCKREFLLHLNSDI